MSTTTKARRPRKIRSDRLKMALPDVGMMRKGRNLLTADTLHTIRVVCRVTANPTYAFIASSIGVSVMTFHRWLNRYVGLRERIEEWRNEGMRTLRRIAFKIAKSGDGKMLRYLLDRRDDDFKPREQIDVNDITPNYSRDVAQPDFL